MILAEAIKVRDEEIERLKAEVTRLQHSNRGDVTEPEFSYLPCPFCGKEPHRSTRLDESLWSHNLVTWYEVGCRDCDIGMSACEDEEDLLERWNQRKG
jgi:Lar family restriction alleviation protein